MVRDQSSVPLSSSSSHSPGQYYSQEAIYEMTSPAPRTVKQVVAWLQEGQASQIAVRNHGGFVTAVVSVKQVASLFDHSQACYRYRHARETDQTIVRCPHAVSVPETVFSSIQLIDGLNNFPCR